MKNRLLDRRRLPFLITVFAFILLWINIFLNTKTILQDSQKNSIQSSYQSAELSQLCNHTAHNSKVREYLESKLRYYVRHENASLNELEQMAMVLIKFTSSAETLLWKPYAVYSKINISKKKTYTKNATNYYVMLAFGTVPRIDPKFTEIMSQPSILQPKSLT